MKSRYNKEWKSGASTRFPAPVLLGAEPGSESRVHWTGRDRDPEPPTLPQMSHLLEPPNVQESFEGQHQQILWLRPQKAVHRPLPPTGLTGEG